MDLKYDVEVTHCYVVRSFGNCANPKILLPSSRFAFFVIEYVSVILIGFLSFG